MYKLKVVCFSFVARIRWDLVFGENTHQRIYYDTTELGQNFYHPWGKPSAVL